MSSDVSLDETSYNPERQVYSYDIVKGADIVGFAQLRIVARKSASLPEGFENNIYYEIKEVCRGKGYAKKALQEILAAAEDKSLEKVRIAVKQVNKPSLAVISSVDAIEIDRREDYQGEVNILFEVLLK